MLDVRRLVPGHVLTDPMVAGIFRAYNISHGSIATYADGTHKVLHFIMSSFVLNECE